MYFPWIYASPLIGSELPFPLSRYHRSGGLDWRVWGFEARVLVKWDTGLQTTKQSEADVSEVPYNNTVSLVLVKWDTT